MYTNSKLPDFTTFHQSMSKLHILSFSCGHHKNFHGCRCEKLNFPAQCAFVADSLNSFALLMVACEKYNKIQHLKARKIKQIKAITRKL